MRNLLCWQCITSQVSHLKNNYTVSSTDVLMAEWFFREAENQFFFFWKVLDTRKWIHFK